MKKCYYARPLNLYGTPQDIRDVALIEQMGFEVVNPNKQALQERYKQEGMSVFLAAVKDCDLLAFRSFPDLKIGAGVLAEIQEAKNNGCLVFELPTLTEARNLSVEATREYLAYLGQR